MGVENLISLGFLWKFSLCKSFAFKCRHRQKDKQQVRGTSPRAASCASSLQHLTIPSQVLTYFSISPNFESKKLSVSSLSLTPHPMQLLWLFFSAAPTLCQCMPRARDPSTSLPLLWRPRQQQRQSQAPAAPVQAGMTWSWSRLVCILAAASKVELSNTPTVLWFLVLCYYLPVIRQF